MMNIFESEKLAGIYDGFAAEYDRGRKGFDNAPQLKMLAERIPMSADILDAGCGSGEPVLHFFAERGDRVTGTDISPAMLDLAAQQVPSARLMNVDSSELPFGKSSFDLITSFYSLFHLEMECQRKAFESFFQILRRGGWAYFTLASEEYTGSAEFCGMKEFGGVELPYRHIQPEGYRTLLENIGFQVEEMSHRSIGGETMLWVLIRKN